MKWRLIVAEFYKYFKLHENHLCQIKENQANFIYIYITNARVLSSTNILPDKNTTKIQKSSQD